MLVESGDKNMLSHYIIEIIEDETLRNKLSMNSIKLIQEKYSINEMVSSFENISYIDMIKVLITGINGFIGRHLAKELGTQMVYKIDGLGRSNYCDVNINNYFSVDVSNFFELEKN